MAPYIFTDTTFAHEKTARPLCRSPNCSIKESSTASSLNLRVNFRLCMTHLRLDQNT